MIDYSINMGSIKPVEDVKLFTALLSRDERLFHIVQERLSSAFGSVDFVSTVFSWTYSRYYEKEMGTDLKRIFLFFEKIIKPDTLPDIKILTNVLETNCSNKTYSTIRGRPINIDPGYLTLSKVVLATTKDYSHRIYIGKGIYAEVTLYFMDKTFQPFPYTYPDYRSKEYISMFNMMRGRMYKDLQTKRYE